MLACTHFSGFFAKNMTLSIWMYSYKNKSFTLFVRRFINALSNNVLLVAVLFS